MKKIFALLLAAVLLAAAGIGAGEEADLFEQIAGKTFWFASGVGAWATELTAEKDGSFTGNYHDSEMGEDGEAYPYGTVYGCTFHGRFSDPVRVDEYTWTAGITVEMDEGQVPEVIEDGIRYVTSSPYGVENAQTVIFFLPGLPVDRMPEDFVFWSHLQEFDPEATELPYYAIWNEADMAGFIADMEEETADETE